MRATKFAAVSMSFALMAGCASGSAESKSPRQEAIEQRAREGYVAPRVGEVVLSQHKMCKWSPQDPMMIRPPGDRELYVDGRCAIPVSADGNPKGNVVVIFQQPTQASERVAQVESGFTVLSLCYLVGQTTEDGNHHKSSIWIRLAGQDGISTRGYVPPLATGYALPPDPCNDALAR